MKVLNIVVAFKKTTINSLNAIIIKTIWIINSKIIIHVFEDQNLFKNTRKTFSTVEVADGNILQINIIKKIIIQLSKKSTLTLINILYISNLKINLINTAMLKKKNIEFHNFISKTSYFEYYEQHVNYVNVIKRQYLLKTEIQKIINLRDENQLINKMSCDQIFKMTKKIIDIKIWHHRLMHLNYNNVLFNSKQMTDMKVRKSILKNVCESCMKAKQQRKSSKKFQSKANTFLKRIHVNIQNPLSTTFKEKRYFLFIKNDISKMFFVYIIRIKDRILFIFKTFKIWIEKQTKKQIKKIRADDELRNNIFNNWFKKIDIQ